MTLFTKWPVSRQEVGKTIAVKQVGELGMVLRRGQIVQVRRGSSAEKVGLVRGMQILRMNGEAFEDVAGRLGEMARGKLDLTLQRLWQVQLCGQQILYDEAPRYLGVIYDETLSFSRHVDNVLTRLRSRCKVLRALTGTDWACRAGTLRSAYPSGCGVCRASVAAFLEQGENAVAGASEQRGSMHHHWVLP